MSEKKEISFIKYTEDYAKQYAKAGKGFMHEFKTFILRGNVLNLAVGVIIGGAFQSIVNSLVNDIIMPVISLVTGGIDFSEWFIALDGQKYDSLAEATAAKAATLNIGVFLTAVLNFLIMAFVIFLIIKFINKISNIAFKKKVTEKTTKKCPYCLSEIPIKATKCAHCTSELIIDEVNE